jgi:hypothetical protein
VSGLIRVPITRLRFKVPITAGMNPYTLLGLVPLLRDTSQDHPPILVGPPCPECGVRIDLDGRHRWIASVMAGRHDVLAMEEIE